MKKQEVFPMKKCKRCGALLEENVTICLHCGIENPVQPEKKKTAYDLTIAFDPMAQGSSLYRVKSRKKLLVFSFLLAFLGVPYFYIEKAKKGWISLSIFFILGGLSSLILSSITSKNGNYSIWMTLIPLLSIIVLMNVIIGVYMVMHPSLKDGRGEYLR